jgi:hypothetical protein
MPNGNTFTGFYNSSYKANAVGSFNNGWYFKRNANDTTGVFFAATGYRSDTLGTVYKLSVEGYIWTSAHATAGNPYCLEYKSGAVLRRQQGGGRVYSVRPIQE